MKTSFVQMMRFLVLFLWLPAAFAATKDSGGELRLYMMPAYPVAMNWDSPKALTDSSMRALAMNKNHMIGHVSVEVNCPTLRGTDSQIVSGAVPVSAGDNAKLLFVEKVGLRILEASWPGKLETREEVLKAVEARKTDSNTLAVATFLVSESTCKRLLDYYKEYSETAKPMFYGNSPRPRRKEGSGCSAFGVSFLEVAGLMTEEFRRDWIVARRVPFSLMGGYGPETISVFELLKKPEAQKWAAPEDPHMYLETFEPAFMYQWVRSLAGNPEQLRALGGEIDPDLAKTMPLTPAIRIDRRSVRTPTEPVFKPGPFLEYINDYAVIRSDKKLAPNGSFELRP
ncbi:MAG TPA: hypothetical protein VIH99_02260 [Bdellovibrionota bacterium]|jgi:hypothetical protein